MIHLGLQMTWETALVHQQRSGAPCFPLPALGGVAGHIEALHRGSRETPRWQTGLVLLGYALLLLLSHLWSSFVGANHEHLEMSRRMIFCESLDL